MPSRLAVTTRAYRRLQREVYVCPSCLIKGTSGAATAQKSRINAQSPNKQARSLNTRRALDESAPRVRHSNRRLPLSNAPGGRRQYASKGSLASSTAINAPSSVPPKYRELHQSLLALQETARSFVDRSRLQLALRSLESDRPVVRVALLGLGRRGPSAARKLARALLSDALGEEEQWEQELLAGMEDGRSLLLRHGDPEEGVQSNPLVKTMHVPSRYLERHNLEILITPLNTSGNGLPPDMDAIEDAVVVPSLTTPNTSGGRVGFVRYPVHKSVIVAEVVTGAMEYGKFPTSLADRGLIKAAMSLPLVQNMAQDGADKANPAVDIDLANHALDLFRTSKANGAQFSDEWKRSRLAGLSEWIAGTNGRSSSMNQATANLISSVITRSSNAISVTENLGTAFAEANTVPEAKRAQLHSDVAAWSAASHRDLQTNLDSAFATSASWRRTVWWRLFWRIDDVAVSASDVLRQSWLAEAEQRLAFLSGQITESGLASTDQLQQVSRASAPEVGESSGQLIQPPSQFSTMQEQSGKTTPFDFPWPPAISLSRLHMLNALVPEFHRKAQILLVSTLSTMTGSAALAALFYAATAGVALYESGAILSLGIVWSLRRLQKKWERERADFAGATREDARRVLGEVETHLRRLVEQGGRAVVNAEDARSWIEAREAIERCREVLKKTASGQKP